VNMGGSFQLRNDLHRRHADAVARRPGRGGG
jgi:hypothetical protein